MITIREDFVDSAAPNAEAAKNGRALVLKRKFVALHRSPDDTLLFGRCAGSGATPYLCSADFTVPDAPVYRCTCPSRQFPCKHALGLLVAYAQGQRFTPAEVPPELAEKREKAAAKVEKKKERAAAPKKPRRVDKSALAKKLEAQLEGLDLLETLTLDLIRVGIGNTTPKTARELEAHAKKLAAAYLPGAEDALRAYTGLFADDDGEAPPAAREAIYGEALDRLGRLHALVQKGRGYLTRRLEDPELAPETDTDIAAWLGHAWQLRELADAGLVERDAELLQLAFHTHLDRAREEHVDLGVWLELRGGRVFSTRTYRPVKAAKFLRSEDSFFAIAQVAELCVYPGDVNPRVRWESMVPRPPTEADFARARAHARGDFAAVAKEIKSRLKNPLGDKHPVALLTARRLGRVGAELVIEDAAGERLVLSDRGPAGEPPTLHLLSLLPTPLTAAPTLAVRFVHDLDRHTLRVKPLALLTERQVLRLTH